MWLQPAGWSPGRALQKPQAAASKPAKAQAKAARNPPKKAGADAAQQLPAETGDADEHEDASDAEEEVEGGGDGGDGWTTPQLQALQVRLPVILNKLKTSLRSAAQPLIRLCSACHSKFRACSLALGARVALQASKCHFGCRLLGSRGVDPTAPGFWQRVAKLVPGGKTALDCHSKYMSQFGATPAPKPARARSGPAPGKSNLGGESGHLCAPSVPTKALPRAAITCVLMPEIIYITAVNDHCLSASG